MANCDPRPLRAVVAKYRGCDGGSSAGHPGKRDDKEAAVRSASGLEEERGRHAPPSAQWATARPSLARSGREEKPGVPIRESMCGGTPGPESATPIRTSSAVHERRCGCGRRPGAWRRSREGDEVQQRVPDRGGRGLDERRFDRPGGRRPWIRQTASISGMISDVIWSSEIRRFGSREGRSKRSSQSTSSCVRSTWVSRA